MQTKICATCNIEKVLTEFSKQKNSKYGVKTRCKYCDKLYRQENKEYFSEYRQETKGHKAEYDKQYRLDNKDHITERSKQYRQTPKGKAVIKATTHNRRAQKYNNGGKHSASDILVLFDLQSGVCPYCKTKLFQTGKNMFHSDHIVPLSKGGSNDISNIQLLCYKCNLSKGNKPPEEFAANFNKLF